MDHRLVTRLSTKTRSKFCIAFETVFGVHLRPSSEPLNVYYVASDVSLMHEFGVMLKEAVRFSCSMPISTLKEEKFKVGDVVLMRSKKNEKGEKLLRQKDQVY